MTDGAELIEVWAERKGKPFDRDTELRLTQKQLIERGATNLAEALDLLPDIRVRAAGRGGWQVSIRGGRKGSIKILIDGVPISDPYYGNFDISSIPVTDIEQIRVSPQAGSPIDGPGGPAGVVEVHTRDAVGPRSLRARFEGSSLPSSNLAATARTMLSRHWALRLSVTGTMGSQNFQVMDPAAGEYQSLAEDRQAALATARLEYRDDTRRLAIDSWVGERGYLVPPRQDGQSGLLVIDSETLTRNSLSGDLELGDWKLQGLGYVQTLKRDSRIYDDLAMEDMRRREDLSANREGLSLLGNRPLGDSWQIIGSAVLETEGADVRGMDGSVAGGRVTISELASGVQMERGRWRLDGAVGLAIPMGIAAGIWPEAKLSAQVAPVREVTFKVIGGHKGRVPTLRERFEDGIGNQALGPEKVLFTELVVQTRPLSWLQTEITVFNRASNGQIRFDPMQASLVNLGDVDTRGVESTIRIGESSWPVEGGALWAFIDAVAELGGSDPLDFLPRNRAEAWLRGRLGQRAGGQVRLRFLGEQIDQADVLDSRATTDVSAWARIGELTATLRVQNLLDRDYSIRSGVLSPGRTVFLQLLGSWE